MFLYSFKSHGVWKVLFTEPHVDVMNLNKTVITPKSFHMALNKYHLHTLQY